MPRWRSAQTRRMQAPAASRPHFEELEPRVLYSADLAPTGLPGWAPSAEVRQLDTRLSDSADSAIASQQQQDVRLEIVFVDTRIDDYQRLLDNLTQQPDANRELRVVLLDAEQDGIDAISRSLAEQPRDVAAVHLISHGEPGHLQLGASSLDLNSVEARQEQLRSWALSLGSDADLLIYGCDVAATPDGQALIERLAQLTGADVAASDDKTGNTEAGGDWLLEYRSGTVETTLAVSAYGITGWNSVLATYVVTSTDDSGADTLRQAILDANANAGADSITFNIAGTGVHTITLASALPTITGTVTLDATTDDSFINNGNKPAIVLNGNSLAGAGLSLSATADGSTIRGLVIKNFDASSILIQSGSSGNTIAGNYFGALNANGSHDAGAQSSSYLLDVQGDNNVIGGSTAADRNVMISNGDNYVVFVSGAGASSNRIQGNYIGTDATGNTGFGGDAAGIAVLDSGANNLLGGSGAGEDNVMAYGIYLSNAGAGSVIEGNRIGVNADGTDVLNGVTLAAIDVVATNGVTIRDNWIANVTPHPIALAGHGILLRTGVSNTIVDGNRIGTDLTGTANWGVSQSGIRGTASNNNNQITNNIIANSNQAASNFDGISIVSGTGNAILGNSIYATVAGTGGLGIDHGNDGVNANDAGDGDIGANNLQNFPVLDWAASNSTDTVTVSGSLNSTASSYFRIEFFANPTVDTSGYGEGQTYLGFANVATDGSGNVTFTTTLSAAVPVGYVVSATATQSDATYSTFTDTSEFALSETLVADAEGVVVVTTAADTLDGDTTSLSTLLANKGADGEISLREAITAANNTTNGGTPDQINFNIAGTGTHTITLSSVLPTLTDAVILDASTDDSFAVNGNRPAIVLNGNNGDYSGVLLGSSADGSTLRGLVITNFQFSGIDIEAGSDGNTIAGNYIGNIGASGTVIATGNGSTGIFVNGSNNIIGGASAGDRNVIGGNSFDGVFVGVGADNQILGNYIGTDASGNVANGNGQHGVYLLNGATGNLIQDNVIAASGQHGVLISGEDTDGNSVLNNRIGVFDDGTLSALGVVRGISLANGADNTLIGDSGAGNWIAGTSGTAIVVIGDSSGTTIQGNRIGTDLTGTLNWGPQLHGIYLGGAANNTLIGGTGAGEGNIIAFASQALGGNDGIRVFTDAGTGNAILGNSIYGSGDVDSLGIDIGSSYITGNDAGDGDTGANNQQNFPVLSGATSNGTDTVTVAGSLNSTANSNFRIEFFATPTVHASGYGEGQIYLGFANVATDGSDNASFTTTLTAAVPIGYTVSATATKSDASYATFSDTSEFAQSQTVVADANGIIVVTTADDTLDGDTTSLTTLLTNKGADGFISLREAIIAANNTTNGATSDQINFNIAGTGTHDITLTSTLPSITDAVIIDATTDDSFAANGSRPAIVLDGNALNGDGLVLTATADGSTLRGLVIQNFQGDGIQIDAGSDGNTIAGNYIGSVIADGTAGGIGNGAAGVMVFGANNTIGGTTSADRNIISGNDNGVVISGASASGNLVRGNYIGTDLAGTTAIGNQFDGVRMQNGASTNTIGGSAANERNVISGNGQEGIQIGDEASDGNIVQGNWIGVGADGSTVLGTGGDGIFITGGADGSVIGGAGVNQGNWIAGVNNVGIEIDGETSGTLVQGNRIGTDLAGTANWGAKQDGILIEDFFAVSGPTNNLVADNIVAFSGQGGLYTTGIKLYDTAGSANTLARNLVYGSVGLGIDLGANGVTANDAGDADTGANNLQNFPVLDWAATDSSSQITLAGSLNSTANSYFRIELFANPTADSSGYGEGQIYLGYVDVATDGSGNASFSTTLSAAVPVSYGISGTATKSDATYSTFTDTSEFARNIVAISNTQGILVVDTANDTSDGDTTSLSTLLANKGADGFISLREAITAANNTANGTQADQISFAIAGNGTHTITLTSALPSITDAVILDASTDDSFAANSNRPAIVLDGNNLNSNGLTLTSSADGSTIRGLLITDFQQHGIRIEAGSDGNTLAGNYIGKLTPSGTLGTSTVGVDGIHVEGSNNIIGGATVADRNLIAGTTGDAIAIAGEASDGNIIQGNWIGLGADGTTVLGTVSDGIYISGGGDNNLIGGSNSGEGNTVVGVDWAIWINGLSSGNVIRGNFVGTDSSLTVAGGNNNNVVLEGGAFDNMVGGTGATDGNFITNSALYGIDLKPAAGTGNALLGNSIWNNAGLGIDLAFAGVLGNDLGDADTGANNLQNFPILTAATTNGTSITIAGTLNSTANSYFRIELFASPTADATNFGEGQIYLGFVNVATDGSGNAPFSTTLAASVPEGYKISATATKSDASYSSFTDTSEFAFSLSASAANAAPVITSNGGGATAAINVVENTTSVTTVTATDADLPAQTLSYSITGGTDQGLFSIDVNTGVLTFNAAPNFELPGDAGGNNVYDVTVQVSDGNGGTDSQAISVTVTNANEAPTVANAIPDQNATEDSAFSFQFAANTFADVDVANTLTYSAQLAGGGALPAWLSFDAGTRTFSGTPLNAHVGTVSIDVTANDGNGGTVTDTFDIVIANSNDAPTVTNAIPNQNATEDSAFSFQFAANTFSDVDVGATLTYTAQISGGGALPGWLSFDALTRTFSGTPANANVGTISIDVIANDGNGGTVTDTFDIVVANSNDTPTVANTIPDQNATENTPFNFTFAVNTFNDQDVGDTLTYSAQLNGGGALPAWLSFDAASRTFSGTPANGDVGTVSIDVIANDGKGGTVTDTFDIAVGNTNDSPFVANPIPNQNATEDAAFNFQFAANTFDDPDVGDTLTYTTSLLPAWLSFDSVTRTFSGTPANADVGTISVTVTATDGTGHTVSDTFDLVVSNTNDAPTVANAIADQNATENAAFNFTFAVNTFNDSDVGNTLTYTAQLAGGGALPAWLSFDGATRTFSGTPTNIYVGTVSIDVIANDGNGGTVTDTFDITVGNTNDAPFVANAIPNQNATEDAAFSFQFAANTFADPDVSDTLTFTAQLAGGGALPAWLSFDSATRTFSGTPGNGDVGAISFDVIANDGHGGTVTDSFSIAVANTNDAPTVANAIPNQTATENVAFNFTFAVNTFNDIDVGDTLTYSVSALPAWLSFDANTRTFSGTPLNTDIGTVSIDVTANDGNGGTVTDTFNITVGNSNDAPTVANAIPNQNATEDAAFSFQFAANTFADPDVGDTLTYSVSALPTWLSFDANTRTFSGTPLNANVGTVSITVTAADGAGLTASDTFDLTVTNTNDAPTVANAIPDQNATANVAFNFTFAANTFNDIDVGDTLTYGASGLPGWLSFDAGTRTFTGTPTNADVGSVSITVTATDSSGLTVSDTFNIVVGNVNDAPTTTPLTLAAMVEDSGPRLITQAELLSQASDADGDALVASDLNIVSGGGSLIDNLNGTWSYTPATNDDSSVAFGYRISDGTETISTSASLDLTPVNDSPSGLPIISGSAAESQTLTVLTSSISDADGLGTFSYQWRANGVDISGANAATLTLNSTLVGKTISVVVTYQDGNGAQENVSSAAIGPVAALPLTPETPTQPPAPEPDKPTPPTTPAPDESGGEEGETPTSPPPSPQPDSETDPETDSGTAPDDTGLTGNPNLSGGSGLGNPLPFLVVQTNVLGASPLNLIGNPQTLVQPIRRDDVATLLPIPESELSFGMMTLQTTELSSSRLEEFSLRRLEDADANRNVAEVDLTTRSLQIGGLALSTLAAAWAVRMSGIMASLMISMPIWRNIDPLPILHQQNKTRRDWLEDLPDEKDFHTRSDAEDIPSQAEGSRI